MALFLIIVSIITAVYVLLTLLKISIVAAVSLTFLLLAGVASFSGILTVSLYILLNLIFGDHYLQMNLIIACSLSLLATWALVVKVVEEIQSFLLKKKPGN